MGTSQVKNTLTRAGTKGITGHVTFPGQATAAAAPKTEKGAPFSQAFTRDLAKTFTATATGSGLTRGPLALKRAAEAKKAVSTT